MIWLLLTLLTKHFIVDFLMQPPWMYRNKGTLGHPGGIAHAGLHGVVTLCLLLLSHVSDVLAISLALSETILHYGIDFGKVNVNRMMAWSPNNSEYFWMLLGFDQFLHQLTYVIIVLIGG